MPFQAVLSLEGLVLCLTEFNIDWRVLGGLSKEGKWPKINHQTRAILLVEIGWYVLLIDFYLETSQYIPIVQKSWLLSSKNIGTSGCNFSEIPTIQTESANLVSFNLDES